MEPFIVLNTTRPNTEGQKQTDRSYLLKQTTEIKYLIPRLIFAVLDLNWSTASVPNRRPILSESAP